jgi:RNA polymerase sigma factor (TIGR02999 family)
MAAIRTDLPMTDPHHVTQLLQRWSGGDSRALDELTPLVYSEVRKLARSYLRRERPNHTLQPTALVNEAYLRLVDQRRVQWQSRAHFFGIAAQMMRRVLVDHARMRQAEKRGAGENAVALDEALGVSTGRGLDLVRLDDALEALAALDARQARIVELRFFGELSIEETAEVVQVSPATVKREWAVARTWLRRELERR